MINTNIFIHAGVESPASTEALASVRASARSLQPAPVAIPTTSVEPKLCAVPAPPTGPPFFVPPASAAVLDIATAPAPTVLEIQADIPNTSVGVTSKLEKTDSNNHGKEGFRDSTEVSSPMIVEDTAAARTVSDKLETPTPTAGFAVHENGGTCDDRLMLTVCS